MSELRLEGINKTYGNHSEVIPKIDLDVSSGEFVVVVGPSGCGKSTLLRMIAGLEEITKGSMYINNKFVNDDTPSERGIGMVFQSYALYPHMTVRQNISFSLELAKLSKPEIELRVDKSAKILQLEELLERKPRDLSGGQRQRVAIGRAIAKEPTLFLFDEPLSNLDAGLRVQMRMEIASLHQRLNSTVIYVTHDQVEAMTLAERIVVLNKGTIEQVGTPLELYDLPKNKFVAQFIGSPKMNICDANVISTSSEGCTIRTLGNEKLTLPIKVNKEINDFVQLGIRPEHLIATAANSEDGALVLFVEQMGNESYLYVQVGEKEPWIIRRSKRSNLVAGDYITLNLPPEHCYLFDKQGNTLPPILKPSSNYSFNI
ncbi:ABC transporter ATP-binding protein [Vibrio nigripulchritudo]|uniref:ABC transporter ATP-binding protein n=1 Tax=Vibrio nigripulchritudo TaxID=28173 RepID=UPI002490660E|nr:sn-glycerol-3-phosphate ABC transporter ATP-binding protein UgpC [Vibrio nigripulchritudo]BDU41006.1 sugar ABC transporter ATP-binding protein [Vibrio nigripulchritudo]BDU46746.1 sugar ABC transporter ATP-binding protein [Vibrio nigripulchritudo]